MLERAMQALLDALPYSNARILLLDWQTHEVEVYTGRGCGHQCELSFRRLDLLSLSPATPDAATLAALPVPDDEATSPGQWLLASPITARGEVLGLLTACLDPGRRSLRRERRLLDSIASQVGAAVENARLYERARREADRLAAVNAVGSAVRRSLRIPRLLDEALCQLLAVTNLELGVVFLRHGESGALSIAARSGMSRQLAVRLGDRLQEQPDLGARGSPGSSQVVIEEDLAVLAQRQRSGARIPRCLMHIPLRSPERSLGIMTVGSYTQRHFAPGAVDLLAGMGSHISLALENAHLYEETQASARHLAAINEKLAQANEALREAIRSKDQFLANVTHELKRPLAPARLVVETLLEAPPGKLSPQRQERLLRNALNNLDNLNALVSDLLDAVRLQRQSHPSTNETVDLRIVARNSLAAMRPLAEVRGIQLHSIIPAGAIKVQGDPEALARVLTNLLSNAIKFNKERGSVLVQLERTAAEQAVFSVTDTGIGIPAHARRHIFEHFYQADSSSTRTHEGLGLGLFIASGIVEQHGGQIRFDTEEGVGTTFTVVLPLAESKGA